MAGNDPHVALLIRHRWLGDPGRELWRCTPGVPSLWRSVDPCCPGCGIEIEWNEVRNVTRYQNVANDRILAEDLAVRLDLTVMELAVERHREKRMAS